MYFKDRTTTDIGAPTPSKISVTVALTKAGGKLEVCSKHDGIVVFVRDESNDDDKACPLCFQQYIRDDEEQVLMRLWNLLEREPNGELEGISLEARAKVAFDLIEEISAQWAIDGSMAKEESYDKDARKARKAAKR